MYEKYTDKEVVYELLQTYLALDNDHIDCSLSTIQARCDTIRELEQEVERRGVNLDAYFPEAIDENTPLSRENCAFFPDHCEPCKSGVVECVEMRNANFTQYRDDGGYYMYPEDMGLYLAWLAKNPKPTT